MAWLRATRSTPSYGGVRAGATHAPTLASSVEILLHELGARLILQELHLLLELELSDLFLAAKWALFPLEVVFQKWRWSLSYCPPKSIAVDKQANDNVVHLCCFRKADGLADQAFNARP